MNLASDKDYNSRNGSQNTLACSEAQSSAKAVTAKSLAMECTNCHELQKRCRLLPRRHPILGIKLHVLLQAVEVRRSLCRRVIQPTWRPKHIRCTIVMLSSRCKSLQRRDLSTQTSIACGTAPSAVQCSRNRPRDITRYSHVALRRPKQARHVHPSNRPTSQNQTNFFKPLTKNPFISASKCTRKTNKNHSTILTIKLSSKSHKSTRLTFPREEEEEAHQQQHKQKQHYFKRTFTATKKKHFFLFFFFPLPVPVCIWRVQPRSLSAKCRVPHRGGEHTTQNPFQSITLSLELLARRCRGHSHKRVSACACVSLRPAASVQPLSCFIVHRVEICSILRVSNARYSLPRFAPSFFLFFFFLFFFWWWGAAFRPDF